MTKRGRILILLIIFFLLIIVYLILTTETVVKNDQVNSATDQNKIIELEQQYKKQVIAIFNDYTKLITGESYTLEQVSQLKNRLLDLKVPTKFKDLHINFVLSLTRLENYLLDKDEAEKAKSQQVIGQLKADYSWLNN